MRVLVLACLLLTLTACSRKGAKEPRAQAPRAVPVTVATVQAKAVPFR
jgi:predicted small lipoprotein YifL